MPHQRTAKEVRERIDAKLIVEMEKVFMEIYPDSWRQELADFKARVLKR